MSRPAPGRWVAVVLLVTALLFLPSLWIGFAYDYFFVAAIEAPSALKGAAPYFADFGDPASRAWWQSHGFFLWWADDGFRWTFLRPLAVWLLELQWRVFGPWTMGYHFLLLGSYLGLVWAAWRLYSRLLSGGVAMLALVLFATHAAHMQTVWLIVNQHSLLSTLPALLGLLAHLRWREEGWRPGAFLAPAGFVVGLSSGETALAMAGYVLAYELLGASDGPRRRILSVLPMTGLVLAYLGVHHLLGYTSRGSFMNLDPAADPLAFLAAMADRFPALLSGLVNAVPTDLYLWPALRPVLKGAALLACLMLAWLVRDAWASLEPSERRALTWTGAGSILSLLPMAAALPGGRLLLCATVGSCILMALVLRHGWRLWRRTVSSRSRRTALALLAPISIVNLVFVPIFVPAQLLNLRAMSVEVERSFQTAEIDDSRAPSQELIVLTAPGPMIALNYLAGRRVMTGSPAPRGYWVLSCEPFAHRVVRTGANRLEVTVLGGHMIGESMQSMFKPRGWPLRVGDEIDQGSLRARVLETDGVGPTRVEFTFARPLEDPGYQVLAWKEGRLRRVQLPPIGGELLIPLSPSPYGRWG